MQCYLGKRPHDGTYEKIKLQDHLGACSYVSIRVLVTVSLRFTTSKDFGLRRIRMKLDYDTSFTSFGGLRVTYSRSISFMTSFRHSHVLSCARKSIIDFTGLYGICAKSHTAVILDLIRFFRICSYVPHWFRRDATTYSEFA